MSKKTLFFRFCLPKCPVEPIFLTPMLLIGGRAGDGDRGVRYIKRMFVYVSACRSVSTSPKLLSVQS